MPEPTARELMYGFASRTGLTRRDRLAKRYLWTDAFAVCNFLGLFLEQRDEDALKIASQLVEQTHLILARHRPDDSRSGWISGLGEEEGTRHPTAGGLRIGKALPEREPSAVFDARLEWERDGQYFHYLTKWMHALRRMSEVSGDPVFLGWAIELAKVAFERFAASDSEQGARGLYWKMSIDLSRPQGSAMGHHDPLDGLLTLGQLRSACVGGVECDLTTEIRELAGLCANRSWETDDPLGTGGLLCDATRLLHLLAGGATFDSDLLTKLLIASIRGIDAFVDGRALDQPADSRLAFREFGLSIGLHAIGRISKIFPTVGDVVPDPALCGELLGLLSEYRALALAIERFWGVPENRMNSTWQQHCDINEVMYATSLAPGGFLGGEAGAFG